MSDIDYDRLLKLRLAVGRFGEMDIAKWWNTTGQLGRWAASVLRRGFPRTYHFAQARSVFAVAAHRCAERFDLPDGVTLWRLPEALEEEFDVRWEHWLDAASEWKPKPWQKELKATWDALCAAEYDWSHLAIHLWPERVVPRCATDRSLAIAHGLEDISWIEGSDGKWTARVMPTQPIEELVRKRVSPAVKAALNSLQGAPVAKAGGGRRAQGARKGKADA